MRLTNRIRRQLRIAFSIYDKGKNGTFWLNLAEREWQVTYGDIDVPAETWNEVQEMLEIEFPALLTSRVRAGIDALARGQEPRTPVSPETTPGANDPAIADGGGREPHTAERAGQ